MSTCYFHGFYFHFTGGQYLIAGGIVDGAPYEMTEVVELVNTNSTPSFGNLPSRRYYAVGAMFGNAPILCGGYDGSSYLDSCISFQNSQWSQSHSMNEKRQYPAGVQINSTTFWILGGSRVGGSSGSSYLDSTEFIIEGQTNGVPGPDLPYTLWSACAVKLSEEEIFVIGGVSGILNGMRKEVLIYNPQNGFTMEQGPPLNVARAGHSCSTMRDGDKTYIIIAGGAYFPNLSLQEHTLNSTEIYDPEAKTWCLGR